MSRIEIHLTQILFWKHVFYCMYADSCLQITVLKILYTSFLHQVLFYNACHQIPYCKNVL